MHQPHSAEITRCGETGDVADDSTAHGNDRRATVGARAEQLPRNLLDGGEIFGGLAIVEEDSGDALATAKAAQQRTSPVLPDVW